INKVRDKNPDVVDDLFFMHDYSASDFKTILNWLLDEGVSIRDMNTILETMADNIDKVKTPVELLDRIREKLAWQFVPKFADKDKTIHVIRISRTLSEALAERIYCPKPNNELPYYALEPDERKLFENMIAEKVHHMNEKGYEPIFIIVSDLRTALANTIRPKLGNLTCISDNELFSVIKDYSVTVEEELEIDEIKVNESCPVID
ncbi:FHIPEP family type III secretion protein, partial [Treponema sp. JC4]|uniref:FHIPEP family type III secretion protein n=1 Tax=Treponema sp. JC4 TaxID=1124982 RepID=UPI000586A3AC